MRSVKNIIVTVILLISVSGINAQQTKNFRTSVYEIKAGDDFQAIKNEWDEYYSNRYKGRGSGYVQYMRWVEYTKVHLDQNGKIINAQAKNWEEYYKYLEQRKAGPENLSASAFLSSWQFAGPTGHTRSATGYSGGIGRVSCIARQSGNGSHLFVGTPAGGVWETFNGGTTWSCITDGLPSMGVSGIAVHPGNPSIIYILTGDGDAGVTYSTGVLKSTNGGLTWLSTGLTSPKE